MRILILGGTIFLGRYLVEAAIANGHEVTLFNRGLTNPQLYPDVEKICGDRDGNLEALHGRRWDVSIDTSGYVPRVVRQSVDLLWENVDHYTFVSSISVYADFSQVGMDENALLGTLENESSEDVQKLYGPLKAACEREVESVFGERALVIRPGLIVGPHDPTDRFTYWVRRFSQGGEVLVPESHDHNIQLIDVRDLAGWMIRLAEQQVSGIFNATGPNYNLTMGEFVHEMKRIIPNAGKALWVDEEFLLSKGVREFQDLPLWISEKTGWPGFLAINADRATRLGLTFRPLHETIQDTLRWDQMRSKNNTLKAGIGRELETELLREWNEWKKN